MAEPQPPPPPDRVGQIGGLVNIIKGISLTNVLIIALLIAIAIPTFILYRFMTDSSLLNKFTSFYEELGLDKVACTLRIASQRGADPIYSIGTGFAYQGSDRYLDGRPAHPQAPTTASWPAYCETLNLIVDFMRRPAGTSEIAHLPKHRRSRSSGSTRRRKARPDRSGVGAAVERGSEIHRDQCAVLQQVGVDTTGICPPPRPTKKKNVRR